MTKEIKTTKHSLNLVLHPHPHKKSQNLPNNHTGDINIFIGPEGGFTEDEISLLNQKNFINVQLGPRILRTETAPLAIIAILQYKYGDFA
jgi:16S rRNA (uracil1498-N3)-methyltransferase